MCLRVWICYASLSVLIARGRVERSLLARGLLSLARNGPRPVLVDHSGDHAEGVLALETAGFKVERDLVTMRRQMRPGGQALREVNGNV